LGSSKEGNIGQHAIKGGEKRTLETIRVANGEGMTGTGAIATNQSFQSPQREKRIFHERGFYLIRGLSIP